MSKKKIEPLVGHERWYVPLSVWVMLTFMLWAAIMLIVSFIRWEWVSPFVTGSRVVLIISMVPTTLISIWYASERERALKLQQARDELEKVAKGLDQHKK